MQKAQVDKDGYRRGVGMVLLNRDNQVFSARRQDNRDAWQFPQGGIHIDEVLLHALYRELFEEVGLFSKHVMILAESKEWLVYQLPYAKQRVEGQRVFGQRQKWFLLRLMADEENINLHTTTNPEFDAWRWVDYWDPLTQIVSFKQAVYEQVLTEFAEYR